MMHEFLVEIDSKRRPELELPSQPYDSCFAYDRELRRLFPGSKVTVNKPSSGYFKAKYGSIVPGRA